MKLYPSMNRIVGAKTMTKLSLETSNERNNYDKEL